MKEQNEEKMTDDDTYTRKKVRLVESSVMGIYVIHEDGDFFEYCKEANAYISINADMDVMWSFAQEQGWEFKVSDTDYAKRFGEMLFLGREEFMKKYRKIGKESLDG